MAKNVRVIRAASVPDSETYPKRARQLVRHGRAAWVDDHTIRLIADPPKKGADLMDTVSDPDAGVETTTAVPAPDTAAAEAMAEAEGRGPGGPPTPPLASDERRGWLDHLRTLVDKILQEDDLTLEAIESIVKVYLHGDVSPADAPA